MPRPKAGTAPKPEISPRERRADGHVKPVESEGIAPALLKRLKDTVMPMLKDKRLGSQLGILHLTGVLTEAEAEAGMRYADDVGAYERSMGHPMRSARSASWDGGFRGASGLDIDALRRMDPEAAEKVEHRIKRRRRAVERRYDAVQAVIPQFPDIAATIIDEVCCNDRPVNSAFHPGLKHILRNMAVHYGIAVETEASKPRATSRKADAALIAQGAVDALDAWFAARNAKIGTFRLGVVNRFQPPAITAYGITKHGMAIECTIRLKRSGLMAEEINAQLVKAAEAKGWKAASIKGKAA